VTMLEYMGASGLFTPQADVALSGGHDLPKSLTRIAPATPLV
jgi:hypothetical protein